eukprot:Pgem_evm1s13919
MDCEVGECVHEKRVPFDPSGGGGGGRPDDPDDPDPDSPFPIWAIIMVSGFVLSIVLVFGFLVCGCDVYIALNCALNCVLNCVLVCGCDIHYI